MQTAFHLATKSCKQFKKRRIKIPKWSRKVQNQSKICQKKQRFNLVSPFVHPSYSMNTSRWDEGSTPGDHCQCAEDDGWWFWVPWFSVGFWMVLVKLLMVFEFLHHLQREAESEFLQREAKKNKNGGKGMENIVSRDSVSWTKWPYSLYMFVFFLRNCSVVAILECATTVGITFTKEHGRSGLSSPESLGVGFVCTCDPTLPFEGHQEAGRGEGICWETGCVWEYHPCVVWFGVYWERFWSVRLTEATIKHNNLE